MKTMCGAFLLVLTVPAIAAPEAQLFFQRAQFSQASISPDGRSVSAVATSPGNRSGLVIVDLTTMQARMAARYSNADVEKPFWVSDERLIITMRANGADNTFVPGTYAIDRDGKRVKPMHATTQKARYFAASEDEHLELSGNIIKGTTARSSGAVIARTVEFADRMDGIGLLDTVTRDVQFWDTPSNSVRYVTENEALRLAAVRDGAALKLKWLASGGQWQDAGALPDRDTIPVAYSNGAAYLETRNGTDRTSLYRYDLAKRTLDSVALVTSPEFDVKGQVLSAGGKILGYQMRADASVTVWFDPAMEALQKEVDDKLPGTINDIRVPDRPATPYVLVHAYSPAEPGNYLVYDRAAKKLTMLGLEMPGLTPAMLSPVDMQRFTARDGLSIPVYTTVPRPTPAKNLPAIVLVKPKAGARGASWQFDAAAQFLASRGYAVIQVESRGTAGFGKKFADAGADQWGRGMQDDLADAARWAAAQGIADPKRICIAGTAYGGYAATMALVRHPDVFRCAVNWSGMLDPGGKRPDAQEQALLGDIVNDKALRASLSPRANASRIRQPIMLAYGAEDPEPSLAEARALFKDIAAVNPQAELHEFDQGGQHWSLESNRVAFWTKVEAFLSKQLGK